ncbi:MAG: zinc ribbon domain-containing protein [Candidatus Riflebacteria bacterium]|nr:zinc ribbon domain-containing protein [Candidatus Riflebacteria bacterium]
MPLYEYCCGSCRKKFTVLCGINDRDKQQACQYCGATSSQRLVSRVKTIRSEEQIMENLADPSALSGLDENDPRTFADWAKKMAREMGENMDEEIESMAQEEFASPGQDSATPSPSPSPSPMLPGIDDDQ